MVAVILALVPLIIPAAIFWYVTTHLQTINAEVGQLGQTFGQDVIAPAIQPVVNAALVVFFVGGVGVTSFFVLHSVLAHKLGAELPRAPSFELPRAPSFEPSVGASYGFQGGRPYAGVTQALNPGRVAREAARRR